MCSTLAVARRAVLIVLWLLALSPSAGAGEAKDVVISGTLAGREGGPEPGVTVCVDEEDSQPGDHFVSTETDDRGVFRIHVSGLERCRLSFDHPDGEGLR